MDVFLDILWNIFGIVCVIISLVSIVIFIAAFSGGGSSEINTKYEQPKDTQPPSMIFDL